MAEEIAIGNAGQTSFPEYNRNGEQDSIMYFKLYQIDEQCQKYAMIGLVPFFAQYYLEEGDEGFEIYQKEHYVEQKIIPEEGYPRQAEFNKAHDDFFSENKLPTIIDGEFIEENYDEKYKDNPLWITYRKECDLQHEWFDTLPTEWVWTPFVTQQIIFEIAHVSDKANILFCFDWGLSLQAKNWLDGEIKSIAPIPYKQRIEEYSKNLVAKESTINLAYSKAVECQSVDFASLSVAKDYRVK